MMSRILALIKKDIRFNWKIIIGVLIGVTIFVPLNWADYKIEGVWDLDYKWLWCWFICAAGVLAVNPGLRTERIDKCISGSPSLHDERTVSVEDH